MDAISVTDLPVAALGAMAFAGGVAGALGAGLLAPLPGGLRVRGPCCAAVAVAWPLSVLPAGVPLWWRPVPVILAWGGVLLCAADLVTCRLPDRLTLGGYPVVAGLLVLAAVAAGDSDLLVRAGVGGLVWAGGYAAVRLVAPAGLGGGDVKLAGTLGALTAAVSWPSLLLAVLGASAGTAVLAVVARAAGHRAVPHGPAMITVSWLLVLYPPG